jgi:hypothetical protein
VAIQALFALWQGESPLDMFLNLTLANIVMAQHATAWKARSHKHGHYMSPRNEEDRRQVHIRSLRHACRMIDSERALYIPRSRAGTQWNCPDSTARATDVHPFSQAEPHARRMLGEVPGATQTFHTRRCRISLEEIDTGVLDVETIGERGTRSAWRVRSRCI